MRFFIACLIIWEFDCQDFILFGKKVSVHYWGQLSANSYRNFELYLIYCWDSLHWCKCSFLLLRLSLFWQHKLVGLILQRNIIFSTVKVTVVLVPRNLTVDFTEPKTILLDIVHQTLVNKICVFILNYHRGGLDFLFSRYFSLLVKRRDYLFKHQMLFWMYLE